MKKLVALPWKIAFVTGAGSGMGLYMANRFLDAGISVGLFTQSFPAQLLADLQAKAKANNCQISAHEVDVVDAPALEDAVETAVAALGRPDFALNCAGINVAKVFSELSQQEFESVVSVNLFGSRNFSAAVLPYLTGTAHLALVASMAGFVSSYSYAAYNASKYAVVGLAGAIRLEYLPKNIQVSVIAPGEINTPMVFEERKTMHPVSRKMKEFAGTMDLDDACEEILAGLVKRRNLVVPGFKPRLTYFIARYFPGVMQKMSERMVLDTLRDEPVSGGK